MTPLVWTPDRAPELAVLLDAALPGEGLSVDDLLAVCWDDPGVVLSVGDGAGVCAAVVRRVGGWTGGWIRALAVHPGARRQGLGRALVAAGEEWLRAEGASQVRFGGSAPFYLWAGIDTSWTAGLCLAEACGYRVEGDALDLSCPTTMRAPAPDGVDVRRIVDDPDITSMAAWCEANWPHWSAELAHACEQGTAIGAFAASSGSGGGGAPLGFACHSVNRAGWVGPMATRSSAGEHVAGAGSALMSVVCRDLMAAGYPDAHIAWVSNVSFYARSAGARVARSYRMVVKDL